MNCTICGRELNTDDPRSLDCGGDCASCMAAAGDPDIIAYLHDKGIPTFLPACVVIKAEADATCPQCGLKGKVGVSTDAIIHKTMLCVTCTEGGKAS